MPEEVPKVPHYRFNLLCLLIGQLLKGKAQPFETWGSNTGQTTVGVKKVKQITGTVRARHMAEMCKVSPKTNMLTSITVGLCPCLKNDLRCSLEGTDGGHMDEKTP